MTRTGIAEPSEPAEATAPADEAIAPAGVARSAEMARPEAASAGPPRSLYVHIPFCVSFCPYCDFVVVAGAAARGPRNRVAAFLAALRREIDLRADALDAAWGPPKRVAPRADGPRGAVPGAAAHGRHGRPPLDTLYLGGGTPSLLPADDLSGLIDLVRSRFGLAADAEVTLEANPGPDERGDAAALARAGINRVSYGAQALDEAALRTLGRRHRVTDVGSSVAAAREAGIRSVNLDLLSDVPGQSMAEFAETLDAALALQPDHLSVYALTLDDPDAEGLTGPRGDHLPTRAGARRWRESARRRQDDDRAAAMYEHTVELLAAAGFDGYEISNWARPGHESRHNLAYWERHPHEAVGPGAHAFDGSTRRWNAARLDAYIEALVPGDGGPGMLPPGGSEAVTPVAARTEAVILGLRLARGVSPEVAATPPLADQLAWATKHGLLARTPAGRIALTTSGRLLSNELFARLV